jgi:Fe-S cluster biogenesis protein NfuA
MFIQTEETPNPNTLKFLPGQAVMKDDTAFFINAEEAESSPLATALFTTPHVRAVFFGSDFITITKSEDASWLTMKPVLLSTIMEHFVSGNPIMGAAGNAKVSSAADIVYTEDEQQIVEQIKELIEMRVRPAVAQDGGDIVFHSFRNGIVNLEMHGACSGCPSSTMTLKQGIENMLKHYIPEVIAVEPV